MSYRAFNTQFDSRTRKEIWQELRAEYPEVLVKLSEVRGESPWYRFAHLTRRKLRRSNSSCTSGCTTNSSCSCTASIMAVISGSWTSRPDNARRNLSNGATNMQRSPVQWMRTNRRTATRSSIAYSFRTRRHRSRNGQLNRQLHR